MVADSNTLRHTSLNFGDVFVAGWNVFRKNFRTILLLELCIYIPIYLVVFYVIRDMWLAQNPTFSSLLDSITRLLDALLGSLATLAVAVVVERSVWGQHCGFRAALRYAVSRWPAAIGAGILAGLIVILLSLLLVIPGIIWSIYYTFGLNVVALRALGGKTALDYSKDLVKGQWWRVWGYYFTFTILGQASLQLLLSLALVQENPGLVLLFSVSQIPVALFQVMMVIFFLNVDYLSNPPAAEKLPALLPAAAARSEPAAGAAAEGAWQPDLADLLAGRTAPQEPESAAPLAAEAGQPSSAALPEEEAAPAAWWGAEAAPPTLTARLESQPIPPAGEMAPAAVQPGEELQPILPVESAGLPAAQAGEPGLTALPLEEEPPRPLPVDPVEQPATGQPGRIAGGFGRGAAGLAIALLGGAFLLVMLAFPAKISYQLILYPVLLCVTGLVICLGGASLSRPAPGGGRPRLAYAGLVLNLLVLGGLAILFSWDPARLQLGLALAAPGTVEEGGLRFARAAGWTLLDQTKVPYCKTQQTSCLAALQDSHQNVAFIIGRVQLSRPMDTGMLFDQVWENLAAGDPSASLDDRQEVLVGGQPGVRGLMTLHSNGETYRRVYLLVAQGSTLFEVIAVGPVGSLFDSCLEDINAMIASIELLP